MVDEVTHSVVAAGTLVEKYHRTAGGALQVDVAFVNAKVGSRQSSLQLDLHGCLQPFESAVVRCGSGHRWF